MLLAFLLACPTPSSLPLKRCDEPLNRSGSRFQLVSTAGSSARFVGHESADLYWIQQWEAKLADTNEAIRTLDGEIKATQDGIADLHEQRCCEGCVCSEETYDDVDASMADAIFNAEAGSLIGPIESLFGYNLAIVDAVILGSSDNFEDVKEQIKVVLEGVNKVYKGHSKVCIFQPHRISRLKDLKRDFSLAFKDADIVILCPIYTAGEKIKLGFNYLNFAKEIIKKSKVELFIVKNNIQLAKFLKKNMYGKKIVIGMGAGSISNWMKKLPQLM